MNQSIDKSVSWAKKITDLHEQLAPNSKVEMQMDLHNNYIGRFIFVKKKLHLENTETIISILKEKMGTAVLISTTDDMLNHENEMVYLEEL